MLRHRSWRSMDHVGQPEPEQSDQEIADLVRRMKADRPDLDWDNLLMGRLAGPMTDDRPAAPIWEYPALAEAAPAVSMKDLTAARFPVRFVEGDWTVTSIDEELKPFPRSLKGPRPTPRVENSVESVIRKYRFLHDAGVIAWDPEARGLAYLQPIAVYRDALKAWIDDEADRLHTSQAE